MKKSSDRDRPTTAVPHTSSMSSSRLTASPCRAASVSEDLELGPGERLWHSVQRDLATLAVDSDGPGDDGADGWGSSPVAGAGPAA